MTISRPSFRVNRSLARHEPTLTRPLGSWEKFQAGFGQNTEDTSPVLGSVVDSKYTTDLTISTANTVLDRLESLLELRYTHGRIVSAAVCPSTGPLTIRHSPFALEDTRLKFNFLIDSGKPYVGLCVVFPFGN